MNSNLALNILSGKSQKQNLKTKLTPINNQGL